MTGLCVAPTGERLLVDHPDFFTLSGAFCHSLGPLVFLFVPLSSVYPRNRWCFNNQPVSLVLGSRRVGRDLGRDTLRNLLGDVLVRSHGNEEKVGRCDLVVAATLLWTWKNQNGARYLLSHKAELVITRLLDP